VNERKRKKSDVKGSHSLPPTSRWNTINFTNSHQLDLHWLVRNARVACCKLDTLQNLGFISTISVWRQTNRRGAYETSTWT